MIRISLAKIHFKKPYRGGGGTFQDEKSVNMLLTETSKVFTPDEGYDGVVKYIVNTPTVAQEKTLNIRRYGSGGTIIMPPSGYNGYKKFSVENEFALYGWPIPNGMRFAQSTFTELLTPIDTINVTDFRAMFSGCSNMTKVPSGDGFTLSNATSCQSMFYGCSRLNDLGGEYGPFYGAGDAAADYMFYNCTSLTSAACNNRISGFNNWAHMFEGCTALTAVPLGITDSGAAGDCSYMFNLCSNLTTVTTDFDFTGTLDTHWMFRNTNINNLPSSLSTDIAQVANTSGMFNNCISLTVVPDMDLENSRDISRMFGACTLLTSVGGLNTPNVTNMQSTFISCPYLISIAGFDSSKCTTLEGCFANDTILTSIPTLNLSACLNMQCTFQDAQNIPIINIINSNRVTNWRATFARCYKLRTLTVDFSAASNNIDIFYGLSGSNSITTLYLSGYLNINWNFSMHRNLTYDSIKSILTAASNKPNTTARTLNFNRTITDQEGELAALRSACISKNWTISGLVIN